MFYSSERLTGRIENLGHGRYLPVELPGNYAHRKGIVIRLASLSGLGHLTKIRTHRNVIPREVDFDTVKPEVLCCVQKRQKTWNGERGWLKEQSAEPPEARGGDPMNNHFQVSAKTTPKFKQAKVRNCDVCCGWHVDGLHVHITLENKVIKVNLEFLQLWHT
jgi:hypothetical protein